MVFGALAQGFRAKQAEALEKVKVVLDERVLGALAAAFEAERQKSKTPNFEYEWVHVSETEYGIKRAYPERWEVRPLYTAPPRPDAVREAERTCEHLTFDSGFNANVCTLVCNGGKCHCDEADRLRGTPSPSANEIERRLRLQMLDRQATFWECLWLFPKIWRDARPTRSTKQGVRA
jgi:hypothetical protein